MKNIVKLIPILVLTFFVGTFSLFAQELDLQSYAPLTKGLELKYANYDEDGEISGYYIMKVVSVSGNFSKGEIVFDQHFFDEDYEPVFDDNNLRMVVSVGPDGHYSKMDELGKLMKVQEDVSKGDVSTIPSDIEVGSVIDNGVMNVKAGNMSAKILTSDRKVVRKETITTSAGEFEAFVVKETQITKAVISKEYHLETWYVRGIGAVKQLVYDRKGRLEMSQELVSFQINQ
ncbi:MAG: hypothetical protein IKC17_01395 [Bacteroidales bacterium]|nr:hypothetical protein [Bacteroidales bacterium]